jgi:hypothetical protein
MVTETEAPTPLTPKSTSEHDPKPDPSTYNPHNISWHEADHSPRAEVKNGGAIPKLPHMS